MKEREFLGTPDEKMEKYRRWLKKNPHAVISEISTQDGRLHISFEMPTVTENTPEPDV